MMKSRHISPTDGRSRLDRPVATIFVKSGLGSHIGLRSRSNVSKDTLPLLLHSSRSRVLFVKQVVVASQYSKSSAKVSTNAVQFEAPVKLANCSFTRLFA